MHTRQTNGMAMHGARLGDSPFHMVSLGRSFCLLTHSAKQKVSQYSKTYA